MTFETALKVWKLITCIVEYVYPTWVPWVETGWLLSTSLAGSSALVSSPCYCKSKDCKNEKYWEYISHFFYIKF
jgi:hypothetical protein